MILTLIDRRRDPAPTAAAALQAPWPVLAELAAALGPEDWRIDLVLVDDEAMIGLNRDYRGTDEPTDVLSFSYLLEAAVAGQAPDLRVGDRGARCDLWVDPLEAGAGAALPAGEVVLAPVFITGRCRERGWAPDHEMALLVVHGCLHILGWEHDDEADRRAMMDLETAVLRGCGLPHPLAKGA
jgi:probable rRNA maturation factor